MIKIYYIDCGCIVSIIDSDTSHECEVRSIIKCMKQKNLWFGHYKFCTGDSMGIDKSLLNDRVNLGYYKLNIPATLAYLKGPKVFHKFLGNKLRSKKWKTHYNRNAYRNAYRAADNE